MHKKLLILTIFISFVFLSSINVKYSSIQKDDSISVEVRGAISEEKTIKTEKGSKIEDILSQVELNENGDLSRLSLNEVLYNGEIIVIPEKQAKKLVSINNADIEELDTLPGIGVSIAKRIIEYREMYGSFGTLEDLMEVNGIGENKFNKLKEYISL